MRAGAAPMMWSRLLSRVLVLGSIAVLAAVSYYFMSEYRALRERERVLQGLDELGREESPCTALAEARRLLAGADADMAYTIDNVQQSLAARVVGDEDEAAKNTLLAAEREGVLDSALCEQIQLARSIGEVHPVFAFLRYTREEGRACDEQEQLAEVLGGLGSHRPVMLHALMEHVSELRCLEPHVAETVASMVVDTVYASPRAMDDLDVLRIAGFLEDWVPLGAAQFGCRVEARSEVSALGNVIGCTPDERRRVLSHYRLEKPLSSSAAEQLPAGTEVLLLRDGDARCDVMPAGGSAAFYTVPCGDLSLSSDLHIGVRIEAITYGRAEADLVAGVATYVGRSGALTTDSKEPELRSWFGYDRDGHALGAAHRVELQAIAAILGEDVPERPLRAFCRRSGARYCYDVDWAHAVSRVAGEAVIFLSRPARVFLEEESLSRSEGEAHFWAAFGRAPKDNAYWRVYRLGTSGELLVEALRDKVEVRWRSVDTDAWQSQSFGKDASEGTPESARLLAALDIQRDGKPELLIQRATYRQAAQGVEPATDDVLLLHLADAHGHFVPLNHLTVHEY